jgi:hypothetical protein
VAPPAVARQSTWALHVVRLGRWVVFGLAAGGVGYWWGFQRAAHAPLEHVAAPVEQRVVGPSVVLSPAQPSAPAQPDFAPPSAPSSEPEPEPARAAPVARGASEAPARRRLAPRRATAPSLQPLDLHEALQLLSRAQSALRKGLPDRALELLDQLEQRQPGELLMEERRVTRILTLCELGEVDQARAVRQTLGPGPVSSIYAGRLDASCAGVEPASTDLKNSVPRPDPAAPDTTRP